MSSLDMGQASIELHDLASLGRLVSITIIQVFSEFFK